jgi:hypothetical protein
MSDIYLIDRPVLKELDFSFLNHNYQENLLTDHSGGRLEKWSLGIK